MLSTREAYGAALVEEGRKRYFYVLDADLSKATQTVHFAKQFPHRFFDVGIAEANMMGVAAGLSTCGIPVVVSTFAAFAAGRAYDQVRNGIAYPNCNVKIGATHGGVLIGADGGSHQCIEDLALMRVIPNMVVLCPCDELQTKACVEAALAHYGPVYLRCGRAETEPVFERSVDFQIGKGTVLRDGVDVTVVAVGAMVARAIAAAKVLETEGIHAAVLDMASVKPIDRELLRAYAKKTGRIVTAEDHNVVGGLGSAVCEALAGECPVPVAMVGMNDCFGRSGSPAELARHYGLTVEHICAEARALIKGV